jgi:hypothetical protein
MTAIAMALLALLVLQDPGTVDGVVINAATKSPVSGALVLLARTDGPLASAVVVSTNDRGRFTFSKVPPGTYRLRAEHDDYMRSEVSPAVTIEPGAAARNLTIAVTPTAVISGIVLDEFGAPMGKVYVRAFTTHVVAEVRTNDLGEYRLFGLEPGTYVVGAERYKGPTIEGGRVNTPTPPCPDCMGEGTMMMALTGLLASGAFIDPRALTGQTYLPVFYPGTTDRGSAEPIKVAAGARIEGIDLRLIVR